MPLVKHPSKAGYIFVNSTEEKVKLEEEAREQKRLLELQKINVDINNDGVVDEKDMADLADAMALKKKKKRR